MDQIFHKNFKKIHFVGIGGISMSGLAKLCFAMGYVVSGSDLAENAETAALRKRGIAVFSSHAEENVEGADVVVFSSAIGTDNPELQRAVLAKKCVLSRGKFLSLVSRQFRRVVAISGAHGKTTASALLSEVLARENAAFCYHIGGVLKSMGENTACFGDDLFVCEACEYKRNFLALEPDIGVVLNIDFDHPDYYRDLEDVRSAYRSFAGRCGRTVGHVSAEFCDVRFAVEGEEGAESADVLGRNLERTSDGKFRFEILCDGRVYAAVSPFLFRHNVLNVLAVFAVCRELGLDLERALAHISNFEGVERRFERLCAGGLELWSDYAHHPKQIAGVLRALKEEGHRVVCVFEPHTYSRTVKLFCDFVDALKVADEVILLPVFAAREAFVPGVIESLREEVEKFTPCRLLEFSEVMPALAHCEGTKVLLGAGAFDEWLRRQYGLREGEKKEEEGDARKD